MTYNSVIIASTAGYLINTLREKLNDIDLRVFAVGSDEELKARIKLTNPRYIFIENCFKGHDTDGFIQQLSKSYRGIRIIVWSVSEVSPIIAARLINAGAESFFCLRETEDKINSIINRIVGGQSYCPADVKAVLDKDNAFPIFGNKLTPREIQVMKACVRYRTNQQIGNALSLSRSAIKFHKANIYRKCGGDTPVDILINGIIKGIILPEELV
jgi:DNA-binding NarL/FixJ family response regulator